MVIPVIEEQVVITREVVESGRLHVSKRVIEQEQQVDVELQHDEVHVEHIPVNRFVADGALPPGMRQEGDTIVIPVLREVVVTRTLVVEEVRITKQAVQTHQTEKVVLRHEDVQINRRSSPSDEATPSPTQP